MLGVYEVVGARNLGQKGEMPAIKRYNQAIGYQARILDLRWLPCGTFQNRKVLVIVIRLCLQCSQENRRLDHSAGLSRRHGRPDRLSWHSIRFRSIDHERGKGSKHWSYGVEAEILVSCKPHLAHQPRANPGSGSDLFHAIIEHT